MMFAFLDKDDDNYNFFKSSDVMASQELYYALEANSIDSPVYKKVRGQEFYKLKGRAKKCAFFEAFNVVRNSLIKASNLKDIGHYLQDLIFNDFEIMVDFLSGKRLDAHILSDLKARLEKDVFKKPKSIC